MRASAAAYPWLQHTVRFTEEAGSRGRKVVSTVDGNHRIHRPIWQEAKVCCRALDNAAACKSHAGQLMRLHAALSLALFLLLLLILLASFLPGCKRCLLCVQLAMGQPMRVPSLLLCGPLLHQPLGQALGCQPLLRAHHLHPHRAGSPKLQQPHGQGIPCTTPHLQHPAVPRGAGGIPWGHCEFTVAWFVGGVGAAEKAHGLKVKGRMAQGLCGGRGWAPSHCPSA